MVAGAPNEPPPVLVHGPADCGRHFGSRLVSPDLAAIGVIVEVANRRGIERSLAAHVPPQCGKSIGWRDVTDDAHQSGGLVLALPVADVAAEPQHPVTHLTKGFDCGGLFAVLRGRGAEHLSPRKVPRSDSYTVNI